jgi:hypothetical protein
MTFHCAHVYEELLALTGSGRLDSCRGLFKKLQILPLLSQYIFSILFVVVKHKNYFRSNADIHYINTHLNHNLHLPFKNLSFVQRGVLYSSSRIYNHIPSNIKLKSDNIKEFKLLLKIYLTEQVFCRMVSSGMLRHMALVRTDVSEERSASFIRVTRIGELGTTLAVTSNQRKL